MSSQILIGIAVVSVISIFLLLKKKKFILFSVFISLLPAIKIFNDYLNDKAKTFEHIFSDIIFVLVPAVVFGIFTNWDKIKYGFNYVKSETFNDLKKQFKNAVKKKENLVNVLSKFFNDGKINRKNVAEKLNISVGDFFAVVKTAENLDELYERKKKLNSNISLSKFPLGEILKNINGSLRPFGNMDIYFIPFSSISKKYGFDHEKWLKKEIIPRVPSARSTYLRKVTGPLKLSRSEVKRLKKPAFTIVSFEINNRTLFAETINNRISRDLFYLLRNDHSFMDDYANKIGTVLRAKELFNMVEWQSIVDLAEEKIKVLNLMSETISKKLHAINVKSLIQLSDLDVGDFSKILFNVTRKKYGWTERVCKNTSGKVIGELKNIIAVLREAEINI